MTETVEMVQMVYALYSFILENMKGYTDTKWREWRGNIFRPVQLLLP